MLRGNRGEAAGTESGSSFVERITVNTGTVPVPPAAARPVRTAGLGAPAAEQAGTGRSRRSTPSRGEPGARGRAAAVPRREGDCNAARRAAEWRCPARAGPWPAVGKVAGMQAKLHRWAAAGPGRRFDDLFNLVHDPATLTMAYARVAGNTGANTPGVDGLTAAAIGETVGVPGFLGALRAQLKAGTFRPLPVRERKIPKPGGSGKVRKPGIPVIADRVGARRCETTQRAGASLPASARCNRRCGSPGGSAIGSGSGTSRCRAARPERTTVR